MTKTSKSVLTDDSVMVALGELRALEGQRMDQERAEKARAEALEKAEAARRVEEAAAAARHEAAQRALAVSEIEARVRAEAAAEVARDATANELRAQLAKVQAERAALHQALEVRAANALQAQGQGGAQQSHGWAMAFGLASVVAAGLAGLLAFQSSQPMAIPEPTPGRELTHAVVQDQLAEERAEVAAPEPAPAAPEVAVPSPTPRAGARPHRVRDTSPVRIERTDPRDDLDFGDEGDVLGHLSQTRGLR